MQTDKLAFLRQRSYTDRNNRSIRVPDHVYETG